ncbi:helix-turn-helix domain-containing protein [Priestia sp. OVS21]|nr:helix-turn-helix domain-containing protein [Priestia sp. OVS21]
MSKVFNKRLLELRKDKNKTQEDMSKILGVHRGTYANYEKGNRQPDFDMTKKIADYFDVTVDYLIGRTNDPQGDSLKDDEKVLDGFWGYDLTGLSEEEIQELKKQIRKEIEFYLWQKKKTQKSNCF